MKAEVTRHLQTAKLLLEGIEDSFATWDTKHDHYLSDGRSYYGYANSETEHSKESVIRRCIQARQELLQVMKGLK